MNSSISPNPYQSPAESEGLQSLPEGREPRWFTTVLLILSLIFTILVFVLSSVGLLTTAIRGPLPPPTRYGPVHFLSSGSVLLLPIAVFWGKVVLSRRRIWYRNYLWLALIPFGLLLLFWIIAFVVACLRWP